MESYTFPVPLHLEQVSIPSSYVIPLPSHSGHCTRTISMGMIWFYHII